MLEQVHRRARLPASRPAVWRALTAELGEWFGAVLTPGAVFEAGEILEFRWPDGTARAVMLEEVVFEQLLAFRWLPFARDARGMPSPRDVTRVELELLDDPEGVALLVTESSLARATQQLPRVRVHGGAA